MTTRPDATEVCPLSPYACILEVRIIESSDSERESKFELLTCRHISMLIPLETPKIVSSPYLGYKAPRSLECSA